MKQLKTFTYPWYPTPNIKTWTRRAARIVLIDSNRMIPLIYTSKNYVYHIPGWWIDEWESVIQALHREVLEETGCVIEILWEIGEIVDKRPADVCKFWVNLIQTSFCYYWKVINKWNTTFTLEEKSQWYELVWIPVQEVLKKMNWAKARIPKAEIEAKRDIIIFEEYLKIMNIR